MPSVRDTRCDALEHKRWLNESRRETRLHYGFGVIPARTIKVCTECGAVCKATENFCTECGARLPEKNLYEKSIEKVARCPHCRAILSGDESFCPICGKRLQTDEMLPKTKEYRMEAKRQYEAAEELQTKYEQHMKEETT